MISPRHTVKMATLTLQGSGGNVSEGNSMNQQRTPTRADPGQNFRDIPIVRTVFAPTLIGTLAGLATVPLAGYCHITVAVGGAGFTATLIGVWSLVGSFRLRRIATSILPAMVLLPVLVPYMYLPDKVSTAVFYGIPVTMVVSTTIIAAILREWSGCAATMAAWALFLILSAGGICADAWQSSYGADTLLMEPLMGMPVALLGAHLGGIFARHLAWPLRLAARLLGVAMLVLIFRVLILFVPPREDAIDYLRFETFGQTFWWWAPGLAAAFALEARQPLYVLRRLPLLSLAAALVFCLAIVIDRADPAFAPAAHRRIPWMSSNLLHSMMRPDYPPTWRPEIKGGDFFGRWDGLQGAAWGELEKRGEPLPKDWDPF